MAAVLRHTLDALYSQRNPRDAPPVDAASAAAAAAAEAAELEGMAAAERARGVKLAAERAGLREAMAQLKRRLAVRGLVGCELDLRAYGEARDGHASSRAAWTRTDPTRPR